MFLKVSNYCKALPCWTLVIWGGVVKTSGNVEEKKKKIFIVSCCSLELILSSSLLCLSATSEPLRLRWFCWSVARPSALSEDKFCVVVDCDENPAGCTKDEWWWREPFFPYVSSGGSLPVLIARFSELLAYLFAHFIYLIALVHLGDWGLYIHNKQSSTCWGVWRLSWFPCI